MRSLPAESHCAQLDARSGAAISNPTATLLFGIAAPFTIEIEGFDVRTEPVFAAVGLFFPAIVTLLAFRWRAAEAGAAFR